MKVTRALVWSLVEWGEGLVGGKGLGVVFYAAKIYLACGLILSKKLLIELVIILNHLGVIHFVNPSLSSSGKMNNRSFV